MADISTYTGGIAQTNGYLFHLPSGTILVDAPDGVAAWLKMRGVKVDVLLLTHQHFDHVMDAAAVKEQQGCQVYAWSALSKDLTLEALFGASRGSAYAVPEFVVDVLLAGQSELALLGLNFELMHVPGHSPDSLCFYLAEAKWLFGGDVLFLDGVGRTDFPGGSFQQLADGIEAKLWPLPAETTVWPGHGGKTTIGREKEENPFVGQA
jgi:glyoxylase-like metal-dependent hydrolase (beta-lactamase superfamily II)